MLSLDDPEETLAPAGHLLWLLPADVGQPRQNGVLLPCHLPEPTASLLRQGLPLPVVEPSRARETCLVAGQARKHLSASCSVHGINCCLFKRVLNKVFPSTHGSLGPGFYCTSVCRSGLPGSTAPPCLRCFLPGDSTATCPW